MRSEHYTKLDEHSDQADSSNPDAQSNMQAEKQLMRLRPRNSKNRNEGQSDKKFKEMKNIYLDGLNKRVDTKSKTQKIQNKINADQLIKVLQNGRNRRNLRRKQNQDQINQDDGQDAEISQKDYVLTEDQLQIVSKSEQISAKRQSIIDTPSYRNVFQSSQAQLIIQRAAKELIQQQKGNNRRKVTQQQKIPEQIDLKLRKALKQMKLQERRTSRFKQEAQRKVPQPQLKIKKVLKQMKEEQKRISKLKQQSEWKQIQNLLISKSQNNSLESPLKQKQNASRRHELQAAKQLLTGKVSIIWVFVISGKINEADKARIIKMYNGLSDTPYVVPLCSSAPQIVSFLAIPNSLFKIVTDLQNCKQVLKTKGNNKIVEFYVYNDKGEQGIAKALAFKAQSRKVKGIFSSLKKLIDRAEEQIQNQVQLFQTKKGLSKKNNSKKFPSFIKLSGEDKTYATLYRANLYGAKNMQKAELQQRYNQFMNLVQQKYGNAEHEKKNVADYRSLNHFEKQISLSQARQIIKFYVRQSFYYQILNSMLRTMKTTQQFKPCIFPFYQNYHSVKKFYILDLQQNNHKINAITLYRGARLRDRDFKSLQPGIFVQMLGFMSTSKSLERARQFCDRDGYIFVIQIPTLVIQQRFNKYDHGFVDINKHKLASKEFSVQEQVLFNALNVFKVTKIVKDGTRHYIHMEYGAIFDLLNKQKQTLSNDEKDVLLNYKYCAHMLDEIEDQGDVYMLANQYEESKQYYKQKIEDDKTTNDAKQGKYYYKLANVQQQCGELQAANRNVQISLKMQIQNLDINDREKCLKVFSIHSKNAQISLDQEDYLTADEAITQAIQMLDDDNNEFQIAKKFRQRGQIKFKKGEIIQAEKDFQRSQMIFKKLTTKASQKKIQINRKYHFSLLTLICSSTTQEELAQEKAQKLKEVEMIEKQIKNMEEMINQQLIKVNGSLKQVANYAEDKQKYQICVKKARAYLLGVQSRKTNDPIEKAKLKALQATIQDYLQLAESQKLLYEAIQLVESGEPFNPSVGKYSQILANLQKKQLEKFSNPKQIFKTPLQKGMQPIKYDEQQHNQIYNKCKKNFEKAINVLLYNNNTKDLPQVISLKNQLGELQYHQSKFQESERIIKEAKQIKVDGDHSQVARSSLLLSKIGYSRGQLRNAFENVSQAFNTLRNAIVKKNQEKYIKIFDSNDLLLEIKLHRSKIYLKQLNHDLSLKDLEQMKYAIERKVDQKDSHTLLADIYEIKAENLVSCNKSFESQFYKALKLRQKQIGQLNLANGVTYCNFAKYLILVQDLQLAQEMLHKALQIFTCFSEQHPITWLLLYCTGLMKQKKKKYDDSIEDIRKSLKKAQKKYDKGHITVNKIRLQFAKALQRAGRIQQAIKQFQSLELDLQDQISASQARNVIVSYKDDQKISVKKFLYESLKESYKQRTKLETTNLKETTLALDRCDRKMDDLRNTFNMEGKKFKQ